MDARIARAVAAMAACAAVGLLVGSALRWTPLQTLTMIGSLALFSHWVLRLRAGDGHGFLAKPAAGVAVVFALIVLAWAAFVLHPTGGLTGTPPIDGPGFVRMPRFLSMFVALVPAAPYAAYVVVALFPSRGA